MAEWWNLDQTLIWMLMRDPSLVALAAGDARGARPRKTYFFAELEFPEGDDEDEDDGVGETPSRTLISRLHNGDFKACDVAQNPPEHIETAFFGEYDCVLSERSNPVMTLRTAAPPFSWLHINIDADTVREHFPPKAPADMQEELAEEFAIQSRIAPAPVPPPIRKMRNKMPSREDRARSALADLYPEGLADATAPHGRQATQIKMVIARVLKRDGIEISSAAVRRAAGLIKPKGDT